MLAEPTFERKNNHHQRSSEVKSHRILCIGETWLGSDARAAFAALRRLGNSVQILDENNYIPLHWQTTAGKTIRKLFRPLWVRELRMDAIRAVERYKPDCLFVFKGNWVDPEIIRYCRRSRIAAVNYYPDVSFLSHGPYIPKTLPLYDQVFSTKSYGIQDLQSQLGIHNALFLEPGYDPELHRPITLTEEDRSVYGCDVAFIGTWSPKKESTLAALREALPQIKIKIWGFQWDRARQNNLSDSVMGHGITGDEYTKAICGSSICLGLLSEIGMGASSGDLITARTFQIPACGTFLLHERNPEVSAYFKEGHDAEFFSSAKELSDKVNYYLANEDERQKIARNGLLRSVRDDYSIDNRMKTVLQWLDSIV